MGSVNLESYKVCVLFILIRVTLSYKTINIVDYKQCPKLPGQSVQLQTESLSGLIFTLGSLKDRAWQRDSNFVCKFRVRPLYPNMGIFIVIQNIVFRKNNTKCIDYVQYRRDDGSTSKQYCGRLTASLGMDRIFAPDAFATDIAPTGNSFISNFGDVEVTIHISKEPLLKAHEEMDLEIVFTLFLSCDLMDYSQCGVQYKDYCIYKEFLNDGYVNCPYPDCTDEGGCYQPINETRTSIGNNVVIGSVTSLLIIFLFFICSLWLCRKYKKLCWEENFSNSHNRNQTTAAAAASEDNFNNISLPGSTRDTTLANINVDEDKDLPPTYDSLFPNR